MGKYVTEAKRRNLSCGVSGNGSSQVASTNASGLPAGPSNPDAYWHNCFGTYTSANGNKYVGEYKNGKRHGNGTFIYGPKSEWAGDKYVGEFKDGKRYGQGTYTWANGEKDVGEFKNGVLDGFAIRYFADGTIDKEGIWKDDEFQYPNLAPSGSDTQVALSSNTQANTATLAELVAAQRKAEELEQRLADLEAKQQQQKQTISNGQPDPNSATKRQPPYCTSHPG